MVITLEISHYPLIDNYESDIIEFIHRIKKNNDLVIMTNSMSTQVKGEYDVVVREVCDALKHMFESGHMSATVMKIIPRDLPVGGRSLDF